MKIMYIFIISIFSFSFLNGDLIDEIVNKIKTDREGKIPLDKLKSIDSPIIVKTIQEKLKNDDNNSNSIINYTPNIESFVLKAIVNNKAFINNKWYKIGDKVNNYTLVDIMDDSIYLKNGRKSKVVFFKKLNKKDIKIINR